MSLDHFATLPRLFTECLGTGLLGCTPQAGKFCSCPASRPKKEPGGSDRDISGLSDRGSYTKGPGTTPQDMAAALATRGKEATIYRGD